MSGFFKIEITDADKLTAALKRFPAETQKALEQAGHDSARLILEVEGLRAYPPATAANSPGRVREVIFGTGRRATFRVGYYVRGRGAFVPVRGGEYRFLANSERYGSQWYTRKISGGVEIGNRASYAQYLAGDNQPDFMAAIGWRKLSEVAGEKLPEITELYNDRIGQLLARLDLN